MPNQNKRSSYGAGQVLPLIETTPPAELKHLENQLRKNSGDLQVNSDLTASNYDTSALGLIFLRSGSGEFKHYKTVIQAKFDKLQGTREEEHVENIALELCGFYLLKKARHSYLLGLAQDTNITQALKDTMTAIQQYKPELEGALPE